MSVVHINMVKGNFVYKQWEQASIDEMKKKCAELESDGWVMEKETQDYLNAYFHFRKDGEKEVVVTFMLC